MRNGSSRSFIYRTLAADYACDAALFSKEGTFVVEAREVPGRRTYPFRKRELAIITTGQGVVIRCCSEYRHWVDDNLAGLGRDTIFSYRAMHAISEFVKEQGQKVYGSPAMGFVCEPENLVVPASPDGITTNIFGRDEMKRFSHLEEFKNAVSFRYDKDRPNKIASLAKQGEVIAGMAGASFDAEGLLQVGVDVLPGFRKLGIGKLVVGILTKAILENGDVPYYTTWAANIPSQNLAISVGYRPVFLEMWAGDAEDPEGG